MAQEDDDKQWCDDDRYYSSSRDSDDSPLLAKRTFENRRYPSYAQAPDVRERRSTLSVLMKFFLFCAAMIMFCVLLYIPVYNKADYRVTKAIVAGWSTNTNRDTKLYVIPNNVTVVHEPTNVICTNDDSNKLYLLIVVCSSTDHFEQRHAIRNTWGNYKKYIERSKIFNVVRDRYKNYNYTYDLYNTNVTRNKREAVGIAQLLPEIAKALQSNLVNVKTDDVPEEKRFDDDSVIQEFDMNKELGDNNESEFENDYESNIMKIPPNGYENIPDLDEVMNQLMNDKNFSQYRDDLDYGNNIDYKLVFLLGLPTNRYNSSIQDRIEEEVNKYGDVIQEDFIDSYNNLTLKSIMMLKWINNKCNGSVRYILKTDDDMYINVPNLIANLRNRSKEYDDKVAKGYKNKEYLLIGHLICGARPVLDSHNKWYSPRYMYGARVYPKYVSGTAYLFSAATAAALYSAALKTPYFHLEDIYITGICAMRATPRVIPRDDAAFSYSEADAQRLCAQHSRVALHRIAPSNMFLLHSALNKEHIVDLCERKRLTQVRQDRLRPKTHPKRPLRRLRIH